MKNRAFALASFLVLVPILTAMAWAFLEFSAFARKEALVQERRVRAYQAAEAGLRYYRISGQPIEFELNDCAVTVSQQDALVRSQARDQRSRVSVTIALETSGGTVVRRSCSETY
ncbi:MAG: hypothetical protein AB7S38_28575 [Vulcanimicrobiota bacterium]